MFYKKASKQQIYSVQLPCTFQYTFQGVVELISITEPTLHHQTLYSAIQNRDQSEPIRFLNKVEGRRIRTIEFKQHPLDVPTHFDCGSTSLTRFRRRVQQILPQNCVPRPETTFVTLTTYSIPSYPQLSWEIFKFGVRCAPSRVSYRQSNHHTGQWIAKRRYMRNSVEGTSPSMRI